MNAPPVKKSKKPDLAKAAADSNSEHSHQVALFSWAQTAKELHPELHWMFAIPNGGHRSKSQAAMLRAEGLKAGMLDIFLPVMRGPWGGLVIEMKKPPNADGKGKGTIQINQEPWIEYLKSAGYGVAVCYGWEQARDVILQYLNWKG